MDKRLHTQKPHSPDEKPIIRVEVSAKSGHSSTPIRSPALASSETERRAAAPLALAGSLKMQPEARRIPFSVSHSPSLPEKTN